ncbi:MAG: hypothetical protein Kow00104_03300 [Rhodothalassiaceae bacterium]
MRVLGAGETGIFEPVDLAEIAETLGYADFRRFSRAFKSCNGITPAQFRSKIGLSVSDDQSDPGADSIPKAQSA